MDSRFTPAPNADTRRATSLQCPPRRLRLANGSSPGSAAMPNSIWRWIGLRVLARGSDYVCTLAGRLNDALLHNMALTDRALRQASVAERPVALHRRAKPSRILEGNAEGGLPVLRGGARDLRARSVYRQRYSCRDRSVGPCIARMGPSDLRRKW
jgi:hypothetical protein